MAKPGLGSIQPAVSVRLIGVLRAETLRDYSYSGQSLWPSHRKVGIVGLDHGLRLSRVATLRWNGGLRQRRASAISLGFSAENS
jgi:hypothetical protein